jgi:hypothetical protein
MLFLSIPIAVTFSVAAQALVVNPNSPCADLCGNSLGSTSGSEITCDDASYASSTYGAAFKSCISCELSSTYFDPTTKISDLQYGLYNLRFALSWCLFGWDNNTQIANTPCLTSFSCGPIQSAFEYDSLNQNASSYSYCPLMNSVSVPKCSACLSEMNNENYLSNFVTVLEAACQQQPVPGGTLSVQGSVFSETIVNITTATPSASSSAVYQAGANGLTRGAIIGIVIGGLVFLVTVAGFCVVWQGKRRRRRILAEKARASGYEWQAKHGAIGNSPQEHSGPFFDSPLSQRPFANAWGDHEASPVSANVEKAYFSPYSSQYTSPVSANDRPMHPQEWPTDNTKIFF